ncbi:hypothetical protein [Kocuria nitroreducens]|uniref:hypothetical protein n=1 Tax=Kocuria nitroreducens TaxID=3058914 RepID=UPI0036D9B833
MLVLGCPALINAQLVVEAPILRREPARAAQAGAATVPAIISLLAAAPPLVMVRAPGACGMLSLGGLVGPGVLALVRVDQPPRADATR